MLPYVLHNAPNEINSLIVTNEKMVPKFLSDTILKVNPMTPVPKVTPPSLLWCFRPITITFLGQWPTHPKLSARQTLSSPNEPVTNLAMKRIYQPA